MKKILLLTICSFFLANIFAQGDVVWKKADGSAMPDTILLEMEEGHDEIVFEALISNTTSSAQSVFLRRTIVSYISGATDQLCYGNSCQAGDENKPEIVTGASELAANTDASTTVPFDMIHYKPKGNPGTTSLKYYILTGTEENNVVQDSVVIKYKYTLVNIDTQNNFKNFGVYPNPFTTNLVIDNLEGVRSLVISNILGKPIYENRNLSGRLSITTDNLANGIYFVTILTEDNKIYTKRVVKK